MPVSLRDYQQDAIQAFKDARAEGKENRFLLTAGVGAGKTIISSTIISEEIRQRGGRCLFVCHRDELIRQTVEKLAMVDDGLTVGVIQSDRDEWEGRDVVVASVQTLFGNKRLSRIPQDYFSLCVVDETHRVSAPSYMKVLQHFRCFDLINPTTLLGITATAKRTDGVSLGEVYQRHVYDIGLLDLIKREALVPIKAMQIETGVSLNGIKSRYGDFAENELASVLNTGNRNTLIAEAINQYAPDRKSLVFCVNVQHALDLAEAMRQHGIKAEAVHGGMATERRREILAEFKSGQLQALTSVMILVEGYDNQLVDCVVWATRTMSPIKYIQGIGRGTRLSPETGKTDLLVLDLADTCSRHSLMSVPKLFDLGTAGERALAAGKDVLEAQEADETAKRVEAEKKKAEEEQARGSGLIANEIDLFAPDPVLPDELSRGKFEWMAVSNDRYMTVLLGDQLHIRRSRIYQDIWQVDILTGTEFESKKSLGHGDFNKAVALAKTYLQQNSKWLKARLDIMRAEPPTSKQISALQRYGHSGSVPKNKLEATQLISLRVARSFFRRQRRAS